MIFLQNGTLDSIKFNLESGCSIINGTERVESFMINVVHTNCWA